MFAILAFIGRAFIWVLVLVFKILVTLVRALVNVGQLYSYSHRCPHCGAPMRTAMAQQERCANCGSIAGRPPPGRQGRRRQPAATRQRSAQYNLLTGAPGPGAADLFTSAYCHHCNWSSSARNAENLGVRHRDSTGHLVIFE